MRVMHVRHVRMPMSHWLVLVRMRMRLAGRVRTFMGVSVMDVMHMRMRVNESLVKMLMLVMFGQVQPYADRHQGTRDKKLRGYRFTKDNDRYRAANEWCCGKVCTGTRRSEAA